MGGKRPDQYAIDPGEAGATDYKSREQGERFHEADKQRFAESERREDGYIPASNENPVRAELRARKGAVERPEIGQRKRGAKAAPKARPEARGKGSGGRNRG